MNLIHNKIKLHNLNFLFVPLIPIFNIYLTNRFVISSQETKKLTFFALGVFLFFTFLNMVTKQKKVIFNSISIFFLTSFNYKNVTDAAINSLPEYISKISNYAFISWFIVTIFLLFITVKFSDSDLYRKFISIFLIIFFTNFCINVINFQKQELTLGDFNKKVNEAKFISSPDIFLVVFDGMASFQVAEKYYNLDSNSLRLQLENLGYSINDSATSAYGQSFLTMSSILNLDFQFHEGKVSFEDRDLIMNPYFQSKSKVYDIFIENNYEIFMQGKIFPCQDSQSIKCLKSNQFNSFNYDLLLNTPFAILINNRFRFPALYKNISEILNLDCNPDCSDISISETLKEIESNDDPDRPNLVLLHYMYTHEPFTVDDNCNNIDLVEFRYPIYNKQTYRDAISCSILQLKNLEKNLTGSEIVIAMSDHGPFYFEKIDYVDDLSIEDIENRFNTFLAYKLNNNMDCNLGPNFQSVNIFIKLFNCLGESKFQEKIINSYFASYGTQNSKKNYGNDYITLINK